jgi:hypothetical protein
MGSTRGFFKLNRRTFESNAFRGLSVTARAAYIEIGIRFFGANNGAISVSSRWLGERLGTGKSTAARALKELVNAGIIEITSRGSWADEPEASCYRLMDRKCDISGLRANQPSNIVPFPFPSGNKVKPKVVSCKG